MLKIDSSTFGKLGSIGNLFFLSKNLKKRLVMDPSFPNVDESIFNINNDWKDFYKDVIEEDSH